MKAGVPKLVVVIPLEGDPQAFVDSSSAEDSTALRVDLEHRDVAAEVTELLDSTVPLIRTRRPELDA